MVPLDAGIGSLGNWKQLGFVAPDAKAMMDRLTAVGFGPFKVYRVDSGDWEGVTYRGAPAERYALEVCMASGTWDVEIIVPIPGGGRTIYGEYIWPGSPPAASTTSARTWPRTSTTRPTGTWRDSGIRRSRAGRSWASTATAASTTSRRMRSSGSRWSSWTCRRSTARRTTSIHSGSSRNSFGLALFLPPIREIAGRGKPGCNGAPLHRRDADRRRRVGGSLRGWGQVTRLLNGWGSRWCHAIVA